MGVEKGGRDEGVTKKSAECVLGLFNPKLSF